MKKNVDQNYQNINELFFDLVTALRKCRFDFCAYVVEEAYYFYDAELEKRLQNEIN